MMKRMVRAAIGLLAASMISACQSVSHEACPSRPEWRAFSSSLSGEGGDDMIIGMKADDHLDGGPDNDLLRGGGGNDLIAGGTGRDRFVYDELTSSGFDRIQDFELGQDMILLDRALSARNIYEENGSTLVRLSNDSCIELTGVLGLPKNRKAFIGRDIPKDLRRILRE